MTRVIDTNVPLVTKLVDGHPPELLDACEQIIEEILEQRMRIVTDLDGEIVSEYLHQLSLSGQPSLGDAFVRYVHDSRFTWEEATRPDIQPDTSAENSYGALGGDDAEIDPSDRKFVAAAKVAGVPVVQATDTKWLNWASVLARHGVVVIFAHEPSIRRAYEAKFGHKAP
ncbi:hypothetical protein FB00_03660 [Cellulosimicrobium funkei]|uniref:PIN domain-containing protein n=1 Tax=Cellulosimicrobium funkei TaxID=264251 RepID=A0A0H2L7G6_9MICO|nr:hypothetical protein [Cellulosimicrobium funkei]KLN36107.1 hypothetical protein FB00_03660 [Cellulosimicrobium funkei]